MSADRSLVQKTLGGGAVCRLSVGLRMSGPPHLVGRGREDGRKGLGRDWGKTGGGLETPRDAGARDDAARPPSLSGEGNVMAEQSKAAIEVPNGQHIGRDGRSELADSAQNRPPSLFAAASRGRPKYMHHRE